MRTVKLGLVAAALLLGTTALTTPAFATGNDNDQDHTCQGGHNCNGDTITNNYDNDTYNKGGTGYGGDVDNYNKNDSHNKAYGGDVDNNNSNDSHNKAYGGNVENKNTNDSHNKAYGGEGGDGGNAKAYGGEGGDAKAYGGDAKAYGGTAYGGKVEDSGNSKIEHSGNSKIEDSGNSEIKNSGNSTNKIDNRDTNNNKNEQEQDQKQKQKQQQKQSQEIKNSGNSYNKNQNDNSNSNNADQEVNVNTYNERAPVNTAYAAPLAVGEDTCMGSSSIGAQAVSFGLSIGTTWQDDNCRRLKNSRQMVALGYHRAATALMCVDADVEAAMTRAGTPCPNGAVVAAAPIYYQEAPVREYAPMAPVVDQPVRKKRRVRKPLPPK